MILSSVFIISMDLETLPLLFNVVHHCTVCVRPGGSRSTSSSNIGLVLVGGNGYTLTSSLFPRTLKSRLCRCIHLLNYCLHQVVCTSSLNSRRGGFRLFLGDRCCLIFSLTHHASCSSYRLNGAEVLSYLLLTSCCEIQVGCRCLGTWLLQRRSFLPVSNYISAPEKYCKIGAATETLTFWMPFHIGSYFLYIYTEYILGIG